MARPSRIVPVVFAPPGRPGLDVEVKEASVDRGRASVAFRGVPERLDFHLFLFVGEGTLRHRVDFQEVTVAAGSLLSVRPGQVHQFDLRCRWRGWMALFRPEFLRPAPRRGAEPLAAVLERLPVGVPLAPDERAAVEEVLTRMAADLRRPTPLPELHPLLRSQLEGLILRLRITHARLDPTPTAADVERRYRRFVRALDEDFARLHDVGGYARRLGCSEKTLSRASLHGSGKPAKALIAERIVLEAKRLLVHTDQPVADIAVALGFDEATNFGKFFRRVAGCTPGAFRARHA